MVDMAYSAAKDKATGMDVAIKKVHNVFQKPILAKRALREIKLLRHFAGHENVSTRLGARRVFTRLHQFWIWK